MSEFQVGDIVECIDDDNGRILLLQHGEVSAVTATYVDERGRQLVCLNGSEVEWYSRRFRLIGQERADPVADAAMEGDFGPMMLESLDTILGERS